MESVTDTFTKLLFPFHMNVRGQHSLEQLAQTLTSGIDASNSPSLWEQCPFQRAELDNLLPYVKEYMTHPHSHLRFKLRREWLRQLDHLQTSRMSSDILGFQFVAVDLHLFYNGIGFVILETGPCERLDTPLTMQWVEDLNADLASLSQGKPFWQRSVHSSPLADYTPNVLPLLRGEQMTTFQFITGLLSPLCLSEQNDQCFEPLVDTFLPVYGAVLLNLGDQRDHVATRSADERFQDFVVTHGIVLRKTLPSSNRNRFSRQSLNDALHHYMPYHNVMHTQSLEGGFVLAYDNGDGHYFRGRPSGAILSYRTNYFYMMLLAFHQRMSILTYKAEAARAMADVYPAAGLRLLREQIYDFSARSYFSQASFSEERDQLYRRWQRAFNIGQMYSELKEQVHDIEGYLAQLARDQELAAREAELRQEASRNRLIALITMVLLPVSISASVIQASPIIAGWLHTGGPVMNALLIALFTAIGVGLILLWLVLRHQRSHQPNKQ